MNTCSRNKNPKLPLPATVPANEKRDRTSEYSPDPTRIESLGVGEGADSANWRSGPFWFEDQDKVVRDRGLGQRVMNISTMWQKTQYCKTKRYLISVNTGEDIIFKVKAFDLQGPKIIWILSAKGTITNASICTSSGDPMTFEGPSEIASLEGFFFMSPENDRRWRRGGMTAYLTRRDGEVVGGYAPGKLLSVTPVQVIAFSVHKYYDSSSERVPVRGDSSGPHTSG